ncbi:MAG: ATP/GTP-binding protein [Thermoplasmata archaeon]|nr:MAG: ATP/GTP-binding protein [Thermoplasmata archaeon]
MEIQNVLIYFIGTAGSGKSTLTYKYQQWLTRQGFDSITINLDPGAEKLGYEPDIDIREWVKLNEIMEEYQLGPNGAQIVCADMLALKINEVKKLLGGFKSNYVLVDTPGQMELFTFRKASTVVIDTLGSDNAVLAFLYDPLIASVPNGFVSLTMLAATLQFRFNLPMVSLLSKVDMIGLDDLNKMLDWSKDIELLFNDYMETSGDVTDHFNFELLKVLESMELIKELIPTSSETGEGMAEIYTLCQNVFMAGDDLTPS